VQAHNKVGRGVSRGVDREKEARQKRSPDHEIKGMEEDKDFGIEIKKHTHKAIRLGNKGLSRITAVRNWARKQEKKKNDKRPTGWDALMLGQATRERRTHRGRRLGEQLKGKKDKKVARRESTMYFTRSGQELRGKDRVKYV